MISESKVIDEGRQGEALLMGKPQTGNGKKLFLESYGCQMNFADSEIIASILIGQGYTTTKDSGEADVVLLNTCAIRENAELRVRQRLHDFKKKKKENPSLIIGVMGCMAERLKSKLLEEEKLVDIVVGPDAYRDLPKLIESVEGGQKSVNVLLSRDETYADISPVRLDSNGVTAFVSITRGCDNMCSFCVVPFTRGRERSRDAESVVNEVKQLFEQGYREVTLLGQNVDSYLWIADGTKKEDLTKEQRENSVSFANLLEKVAQVSPWMRVRFSTSHPKDMTDEVLQVMAKYENICDYIHLPVQSGNSRILEMMNRNYTREWYIDRINAIRKFIPDCGISTDIISGFCSETEDEHKDTLSLMEWADYDYAYMFKYSERPKTLAERKFKDDVPEDIKSRRLQEIIDLHRKQCEGRSARHVGKTQRVLVEGTSKKSKEQLFGRNSQNAVVVFDKGNLKPGQYADVLIETATVSTLIGKVVMVY